jgi:uncharacterized membrane protein YecN with MAPEG domain
MPIVSIYASLLALLFVALSIRTLRMRRRLGIAIGDAGDQTLLRAMRVHSNFAEYVPLGLILLMLMEAGSAQRWLVHALAACLLLGRVSHAYGVSRVTEDYRFRVFGMAMTFVALVSASIVLLLSQWTGSAP